ncbi:uncharacterized protein [Temnothorax longispinosus]|uniref:uncharacterized protein isoform X1 n=1 Tax=Temnothorax longispinosus TaxID=300112 RepID=UPI003A9A3537
MIPSKSKRSGESRRSSILKPRKPRQPLQNVNFDSSSNENSPAASKAKRRVSFAEKKHVKEFCHSTEQGTVWDNTYEEHDFSLKGSFVVDQNAQVDVKDNVALCASNTDCIHRHSENASCSINTYLVNNHVSQESVATTTEEDDATSCKLDFANPVKSTELSNISQLGNVAVAIKSYVFKDQAVSSGIVAYSDTDEESPDKESQARQTVMTNKFQTSKNIKSSSITIYRDEEDYADNVANKCYSKSCSNNVNSDVDEAHVQDLSMELTAPIPAFLSSSYAEEQKKQKRNNINNLDTTYTTTCNNVSMEITEAIPISAKSRASDLGRTEQVPTILQTCENTKWDAANTHNATAMNCANDSMVLTSVIQPFRDATGIGICRTSNTAFDTSMGRSSAPFEIYEKNVCDENIRKRKDQTDKTEIFNDVLMDMTKPVSTILFSGVYNEETSRMDEPISRDDRTMFFHNVSMEMTKTVSTKNKRERANTNTGKSLSEETAHGGEDANTSICFNEGTKILCKSMELTEAVPAPLHYERMFRATHVARSLNKNTCEEYKNDASMELTNAVNMFSLNRGKENLKRDESRSKDDKTMLFNNVSMEMTAAVSSRNQNERTQPIICKSISKENNGEKDGNDSTCFDEGTRLLCKSMEFTQVVPISLHDERTFNTTHTTTQSTFSQTLPKTTFVPAETSAGVAFQTDTAANKTIQDISIEFTAAVPSTLQLWQDVTVNQTETLIISKDDDVQRLTANTNTTKSNKGATKENFIRSRECVEAENIRPNDVSADDVVTQSPPPVNLDHSLNATLENASGKKRRSDASERLSRKRVCSSFIKVQSSQENDIPSLSSANPNYVNDVERTECFVKDIADHTQQVSDSDFRDSLNKINEHGFLKETLSNNSLTELQSITPPSTLYLDNEDETSSNVHERQHELDASIITDIPVNISDRLISSNITESKCLKEKLINIENNQSEACHRNTAVDKNEDKQKTTCQTMTKTRINDNQPNKSTYYTTKTINEESTVSMNYKNGKALTVQDINHCREIKVTDEDQVDEREHTQRRINKEAKLQTDIKMREQYSDNKRQEKCSDHFEGTGAVREDSEEGRKNLNDEVKQQCMEQKNDGATKKLVTARYNTIEDVDDGSMTEQNPFLTLSQKLETHAVREDCIWNVHYKNIDRKMIVFGFMSNSLLIATFLSYDFNDSEENLIKEIKIISRVSDESGILIRIVHKLILEKINVEILTNVYKSHQDILPMLTFISQDVKLAMDFMFDLRRLDDLNLMEITYDEISFVSRSKRMDIILRVTIKVKQFDKLTLNDISLHCLLGKIKETDIKNLIKNVKRDHKFLRRYMNDVKDYIDIMEETQII